MSLEDKQERSAASAAEARAVEAAGGTSGAGAIVGEIASIDERGRAYVVFPGNRVAPVRARSVVDAPARAGEHPDELIGASVLLSFEGGDSDRPIIVGFVRDALRPEPVRPEVRLELDDDGAGRDVLVDGERIVFDAGHEIVLRCGRSTLVMRRDGKVLVRGTDVVSRSAGSNRIQGADIRLN